MNPQFFDILVPKEYDAKQNGTVEKKTAWNKVGRAWMSKSLDSLSFELYMHPNQRYVIALKDKPKDKKIEAEE
jgi:hypothetical protein